MRFEDANDIASIKRLASSRFGSSNSSFEHPTATERKKKTLTLYIKKTSDKEGETCTQTKGLI